LFGKLIHCGVDELDILGDADMYGGMVGFMEGDMYILGRKDGNVVGV